MTAHRHPYLRLADPAATPATGLLDGPVVFGAGSAVPTGSPDAQDFTTHLAELGPCPATADLAGGELLATLATLELTGCGGAHFPVASKWRSHLAAGGGGLVVANGAESEPLSGKDAALLQLRPHLVLDGLACVAQAVGARETVLWLHDSAIATRGAVSGAISERRAAGLIEPPLRIALGPEHYLSGESSSVVRALSGGPALPQFRRVPAAVSGVNGVPTLIHNIETLARIALAARGRPARTTLLTVAVDGTRTVVEVDPATRLTHALSLARYDRPVSAALVGGYGGQWLTGEQLQAACAHEDSLRRCGASLGAGIVVPLDEGDCGLRCTADIVAYLADNGARQCGPCLFGLPAVADAMAGLVAGAAGRRDLARLERYLTEIAGRGACHHPDGAAALVTSALRVFAADVRSHLRRGECAA